MRSNDERNVGTCAKTLCTSGNVSLVTTACAVYENAHGATWRSGYAAVCKTVYTSSILVVASIKSMT